MIDWMVVTEEKRWEGWLDVAGRSGRAPSRTERLRIPEMARILACLPRRRRAWEGAAVLGTGSLWIGSKWRHAKHG